MLEGGDVGLEVRGDCAALNSNIEIKLQISSNEQRGEDSLNLVACCIDLRNQPIPTQPHLLNIRGYSPSQYSDLQMKRVH